MESTFSDYPCEMIEIPMTKPPVVPVDSAGSPGFPTLLAVAYFYARIGPATLTWLFPESAATRPVMAFLPAFAVFGLYCAAGWFQGGPISHSLSVISVCICFPFMAVLGGILVQHESFATGGLTERTGMLYHQDNGRTAMPTDTSYTHLRENLASILDQVIDQQEIVIVRRKASRDVALIPASELAGLIETAHLLRSPRNARRLLAALRRAETGKAQPTSVRDLRRETLSEP